WRCSKKRSVSSCVSLISTVKAPSANDVRPSTNDTATAAWSVAPRRRAAVVANLETTSCSPMRPDCAPTAALRLCS
ncbi:unnamed protein product, partial [Ceratitis capitata]